MKGCNMKGYINRETLEKAFQSEETFLGFLEKFVEYFEFMTINQLTKPCFEMSFEKYVEVFGEEKHEKIPLL